MKTFGGLDNQFTPEAYLQQIDAYKISSLVEQPTKPVA